MAVQTRIQVRRGTLTQWNAAAATLGNGILYQGEIGYETDTGRFKIGDGSTAWATLNYGSVRSVTGVSGIIATTDSTGAVTISLNDPTIQVADITDFAEGVDDRVNALLQPGTNISLSYNNEANTLTINSTLGNEEVQDAIGTYISGVSGIAVSYNDTTGYTTISLSDPSIQAADVTDFSEAVDDRVSNLLTQGSGIGLSYNDDSNALQIRVTGIPSSLVTNFASSVNDLIDSAVSTSIVAGSGIDIVYNSGNNTLTVSSPLTAGSGISLSHSSGNYVVSLSDPTVQLADVADLSSDARTFLLTPSSSNLRTLVSSTNTGSGALVFASGATLVSPILGVASATSLNKVNITAPATSATLTVADGKTLTASNSLTFTGTDSSSVAFGAGGTVVYTSNKLSALSATSSSELAGVISDATGTGSLVFANNPTMSGVTVNGNLTVGGSGLVASNINNFDTQVRTSRLDQMSAPTSDVSLNSRKITNLADPTNDQDAATKAYVDAARSGLDVKQSVRVATTANITLSGAQTIDGVSAISGDRVLVKDQSTASQNGIYVVAAGSWSRATDADSSAEVTAGMFTFVSEGILNADSGWVLTTNDTITLGTTSLTFAQFSGAGQITAGAGLTKSGNTIDVGGTAGRIVVNADSVDLATVSRTDTTGSPGASFVQTVTTDSYGRVTAVVTGSVQDASTTVKGIASFDSGDFSVTSGAVSIKASGVGNSQLENSAITIGSSSVSLGGTLTAVSGLSSVGSTSFVGALTGNASTATTLQTARTINGTSFNGSADITISFVDGGTP
jgi:hypothetical protein